MTKLSPRLEALAEKIIRKAMRRSAAERAETRYAMDARSPYSPRTTMRRSTSTLPAAVENRLMQRRPGDPGYREPGRSSHAFDGDDPREGARQAARRMRNHLSAVRAGDAELDVERVLTYARDIESAFEAMEASADDEEPSESDRDADLAQRIPPKGRDEERSGAGRSGGRGTSGVGETRARSAVSTTDRRSNPDHRRDFNSIAQGGADDSALSGFDPNSLFQK